MAANCSPLPKPHPTPMQSKLDLRQAITPFFPQGLIDFTLAQMIQHNIRVKLAKPRMSVHGWFRAGRKGGRPIISLNSNLKPWMMFLVFVHELAHLKIFDKYGRKVMPHGKEWQVQMRELFLPIIEAGTIPRPLADQLSHHLVKAPATFSRDRKLMHEIILLDGDNLPVLLSDWPFGKEFTLAGGKRFIKLEKLNTRFRCMSVENKRHYLISGHAEIFSTE